ncbi:hypothetical protein [Embleya hyalina]|uniref:Uncharacterized protein n=1 Tax=Embleya hyalina TaxID=516124 RepID=A0A401YLA2_9ACTN|nr:hypothetical protein [Embleya hyalina]GCD95376.1 hypothetical protein EHYA_03048 [Embleya hyalina]
MSALLALFAVVVIARVLATWKLSRLFARRPAGSADPATDSGTGGGTRADSVLAA